MIDNQKLQPGLIKRLHVEQKALKNSSFEFFSIAPEEKDLLNWKGVIFGPENTCYEGGIFRIQLEVPFDYPMKPPKCTFLTKIFSS